MAAGPDSKKKRGPLSRLIAAGLTAFGVPPAVARRIAGPASKLLIAFIVLPVLLPLMLLMSLGSEEEEVDEATRTTERGGAVATAPDAESPVPASLLDAYRAVSQDSIVPWTLLASIAELTSGSGRGYPSSQYGSMLLAPSSGFAPPASGPITTLEHTGPLNELPQALFDLAPAPGSVVAVSPLPPVGTSPDAMEDAMRRAALAVPGSVTLLWFTVDRPDWQTREVVVYCPPEPETPPDEPPTEPPLSPRPPFLPGPNPGPSPLLPSPFLPAPQPNPDAPSSGGGGLLLLSFPVTNVSDPSPSEGCITRVENFIASDENLFDDLNERMHAVAGDMPPNFHILDFEEERTARSMRPGPDGTFDDPEALDPEDARARRSAMASAVKGDLESRSLPAPAGRCPRIAAPEGSSGYGAFGLNYDYLRERGLIAPSAGPALLEDVCEASYILLGILEDSAAVQARSRGSNLGRLMVDIAGGARGDAESKQALDEFWTQVLVDVAPAFGDGEDLCLGLFAGAAPASPAQAIADAWRCIVEERDTPQWSVEEPEAGSPLRIIRMDVAEASRRAVSDALEVSWRHSQLTPCTLFPMSDEQFEAHRPPVDRDRCDPLAEAYAAASLFHTSASADASEEWLRSVAGWDVFEGVLGAPSGLSEFTERGPRRIRAYPRVCREEASALLSAAATSLASQLQPGDASDPVPAEASALLRGEANALASSLLDTEGCGGLLGDLDESLLLLASLPALADVGDGLGYDEQGVTLPEEESEAGDAGPAGENPANVARALAASARSESEKNIAGTDGTPLLGRAGRRPPTESDPYSGEVRGSLPANSFAARVLTLSYSQMPGLFGDMAWEMSGYGTVAPSVPHASAFNLHAQGVDPRLMLALARHHGPLDSTRGCPNPSTSPGGDVRLSYFGTRSAGYGLFGLEDIATGCASVEDQVASAASRMQSLAQSAGGSWQGAVYAWLSGDPERTASAWKESDWDVVRFAEATGRDLAEFGPGDGRSPLAFWYEAQMSNVGVAGSGTEAAAVLGIPVYSSENYTGSMFPPTPTTILRSCPGGCFGPRTHPTSGQPRTPHRGVDFGHPYNTPIRSAAAGVVEYVGWVKGYGKTVIVSHSPGVRTLYAHMNDYAAVMGRTVEAGQLIGYVGSTGDSTGPHLHFEIWLGRAQVDPCLPRESGLYIPCTSAYG